MPNCKHKLDKYALFSGVRNSEAISVKRLPEQTAVFDPSARVPTCEKATYLFAANLSSFDDVVHLGCDQRSEKNPAVSIFRAKGEYIKYVSTKRRCLPLSLHGSQLRKRTSSYFSQPWEPQISLSSFVLSSGMNAFLPQFLFQLSDSSVFIHPSIWMSPALVFHLAS